MATLTGTRATTLSLALVTGAALFSPSVASAATPPTTAELQITGDFLAAQLRDTSNGLLSGPTGWTDIGLTADVIFALDALDLHSDQADRSYAALLDNADDFLYFDYGDGSVEADAGRLAKIVALQSTRGERTDSYVADLVDTVQDDGKLMNEINGEPSSATQNFSQAWSVIALARAGETTTAEKAADFLESQICPDGGIPLSQAVPPNCGSVDPDTTGLAGQALALVQGADAPSTQNVLQYLRTNMTEEGGITSRFSGVNANTTVLAAGAFAVAGELDNFRRTHEYLTSVRFGDSAVESLRGGFAWRSRDMDTYTAPNDQVRRTSAQAALGFVGGNYANSTTIYSVQVDETPDPTEEPTPSPTPNPTTTPSAPTETGGGSSDGGLLFGGIAAILAVFAAVIGFMSPGSFLPTQF